MSAENQLTPWFFQNREIRCPNQVWDALTNNEISLFQYCILMMFHRRVNWETGTAESLSAEQVIYDLEGTGLIPCGKGKTSEQRTDSRERFVQYHMESLRTHGWYHDDYKQGVKRPYTIWLYEHKRLREGVLETCSLFRHTHLCGDERSIVLGDEH